MKAHRECRQEKRKGKRRDQFKSGSALPFRIIKNLKLRYQKKDIILQACPLLIKEHTNFTKDPCPF